MASLHRFALSIGAVALCAGCGALRQAQDDTRPPIGAPPASAQNSREAIAHLSPATSSYEVLHRFARHKTVRDHGGANPDTGLLDVNGTFYGSTPNGGSNNNGTVYSITATGVKKLLYRFLGTYGGDDGSSPSGDLTDVNGTLYGTTYSGGTCNSGTVFSITTTGTERVLHSFCGNPYEINPTGGVIDVNGLLYGSTTATAEGGVVYSISTAGKYKVVYAFPPHKVHGGGGPIGRLANVNGTLYGTTLYGGSKCPNNFGCGTVYSVTTAAKGKILYSFGGPNDGGDGWLPEGGLIAVNGVLYGTTFTGGKGTCFLGSGCGIVYSVTTSGVETVLYRFDSVADGQNPRAGLLEVNGTLYGTTEWGGGGTCEFGTSKRFYGCGTVFSLSASGVLQVLHSFAGGTDGANPEADLTDVNGTLYGTTRAGGTTSGCADAGCGTIFSLSDSF
jgi:uncharacterized repeat protein (TIGR03803 family)